MSWSALTILSTDSCVHIDDSPSRCGDQVQDAGASVHSGLDDALDLFDVGWFLGLASEEWHLDQQEHLDISFDVGFGHRSPIFREQVGQWPQPPWLRSRSPMAIWVSRLA